MLWLKEGEEITGGSGVMSAVGRLLGSTKLHSQPRELISFSRGKTNTSTRLSCISVGSSLSIGQNSLTTNLNIIQQTRLEPIFLLAYNSSSPPQLILRKAPPQYPTSIFNLNSQISFSSPFRSNQHQ